MKLQRKGTPFYIVSTYQHDTISADISAHVATRRRLSTIAFPHMEVYGKYNGKTERSFLINAKPSQNADVYGVVRGIARDYRQAVILYVNADHDAFLIDPITDEAKYIGVWKQDTPADGEDYTINPDTELSYVVRK